MDKGLYWATGTQNRWASCDVSSHIPRNEPSMCSAIITLSSMRKPPQVGCCVYWLLNSVLLTPAIAQTNSALFEENIFPIFLANCVKCHTGSSAQAGLDVRTLAGLLQGGVSGPAVVGGRAERSRLYKRSLSGRLHL